MGYRTASIRTSLAFAFLVLFPSLVIAQSKPAPPNMTVPPLKEARVVATCIECPEPFDTVTHGQILDGLLANPYVTELRRALYLQDSIHQFESKAHFDNCDFESATTYISSLLEETGQHVEKALAVRQSGGKAEVEGAVRNAFFALGQAMHAAQDFYAHTNYVEIMVTSANKTDDIEVVEPWTAAGRERIGQLRRSGLVSGFVFWGFPQKCASGATSHADLAKDSADTKSGKILIPHLQNLSQYRIAEFLARKASISLTRYAFQRWPLLKEVNGNAIAFEVILDHRGA